MKVTPMTKANEDWLRQNKNAREAAELLNRASYMLARFTRPTVEIPFMIADNGEFDWTDTVNQHVIRNLVNQAYNLLTDAKEGFRQDLDGG